VPGPDWQCRLVGPADFVAMGHRDSSAGHPFRQAPTFDRHGEIKHLVVPLAGGSIYRRGDVGAIARLGLTSRFYVNNLKMHRL